MRMVRTPEGPVTISQIIAREKDRSRRDRFTKDASSETEESPNEHCDERRQLEMKGC